MSAITPANSASLAVRGLSAWRRLLADVTLPLTSTSAQIAQLLDPDLPTPRLLDALNRDLPLGLAVMCAAQRLIPKGQRVSNLSHALGMLGLTRVHTLIQTLGQQRLQLGQPGHEECAYALQTSRLAGHFALQFAQVEATPDGLARMGAIQAQNLVEWLLPIAAPALALQLRQRAEQGERPARLEQELLGCRLSELNAAVAQDLGLFERDSASLVRPFDVRLLGRAARLAWVGTNPPEIPTPVGRWLYHPATLPALLQLLAHEAMHDWHSTRTLLLLRALSAHRRAPLSEVMAASRRAAVLASQEANLWPLCLAPLARLFWLPRPRLRAAASAASAQPAALQSRAARAPVRAVPATPEPAALPRPTSVEPGSNSRAIIDLFVNDCRSGRHADLTTFFRSFRLSLSDGLGLQRYALFLKMAQGEHLVCFMVRGFGSAIVPRQYRCALDDDNLLARVFAQPSAFYLAESARVAGLRAKLPDALKPELRPCGAMFGSVAVNQRAVGVLWADSGNAAAPVDAVQYAGFKLLLRHFGDELTRLMRVQKSQTVFSTSRNA